MGMMLVAGRYGRQGLPTRAPVMEHALESRGRVVELTATRFGRPVYERWLPGPTGDDDHHGADAGDVPWPFRSPRGPHRHGHAVPCIGPMVIVRLPVVRKPSRS
ncbi:hypothetical protein GCM10020220_053880 [Nonomuraea rubra]